MQLNKHLGAYYVLVSVLWTRAVNMGKRLSLTNIISDRIME